MRRREFAAGVGSAATWPFARPLAAEAQRRVGALLSSPENQSALDAFRDGLATFGWVEGRNLWIDYRFAGDPSRLAADAEELVNLRPEVIFAFTGPAARAVQQRTSIIPIVFVGGLDPTVNGLMRNIARPEGNLTGFANWGAASQGGRVVGAVQGGPAALDQGRRYLFSKCHQVSAYDYYVIYVGRSK
jgi:putative ABC transport system substrate-binding protein